MGQEGIQTSETPDVAQTHLLGMEILGLAVDEVAEDLHQALNLKRWSVPVLSGERVEGEVAHPKPTGLGDDSTDILRSCAMTCQAR